MLPTNNLHVIRVIRVICIYDTPIKPSGVMVYHLGPISIHHPFEDCPHNVHLVERTIHSL
jgi:hypothetical protein